MYLDEINGVVLTVAADTGEVFLFFVGTRELIEITGTVTPIAFATSTPLPETATPSAATAVAP